jgi:ribosomal protein L40E
MGRRKIGSMDLGEGIRKLGFRRWYERQLHESHLYFVTGVLSLVLVLACFELLSAGLPLWKSAVTGALMAGGIVLFVWAMARYHVTLGRAQHAAQHSVCAKCGSQGALDVVKSGTPRASDPGGNTWLGVRCRKCGHEWIME